MLILRRVDSNKVRQELEYKVIPTLAGEARIKGLYVGQLRILLEEVIVTISNNYQEYAKLFKENEAIVLLKYQTQNYKINLEEGAKLKLELIYLLLRVQDEEL